MSDLPRFEPLMPTPRDGARADAWPDPAQEEFEAERARLEAAIAVARARTAAAHDALRSRESSVKSTLRADVLAAQDAVAAMEREHDRRVAEVRSTARLDADALIAAAHSEAEALLLGSSAIGEGSK
jgi:hypothetical protein